MPAKAFRDLTPRSMAVVVKELRAEATLRQTHLEAAEAALKSARAPYETRVAAIRAESDATLAPLNAEVEAAQKAVWESVVPDPEGKTVGTEQRIRRVHYSAAAEIAERLLTAARASLKVPTTAEEFETYLKAEAGPFGRFARHAYRMNVREPKVLGPFLLLSADDGDDGQTETRVYLAVRGDPNHKTSGWRRLGGRPAGQSWQGRPNEVTSAPAVRGWLIVDPSQHPGDETRASGAVEGKPFLLGETWRPFSDKTPREPSLGPCVVRKPLAQFKAALLGMDVETAESDKGEV